MASIIKRLTILAIIGVIVTGCARFQSYQVPRATADYSPTVSSDPELMTYSIDKSATYGPLGVYEESLISAMRQYGWRLRQSEVPKDGVPHMYVNINLSKDPAALIPAIITGATLYVVPSWETSDYKVTAQILNAREDEYFYEAKDRIVLVQWLPMILAFPVAYPFSAEEETLTRIYENIAMKINEDDVLK
ncbi:MULTISPECIES: hypothetical protein [Marinobacter]|uniref:hypothetical protein n=1 Tax=Marinobacter TaxID=2742 RepID=UPI0029437C0C|nr:hypothetical protein [Marinobacter salarius]WOI18353.1 hypothetical protein R1T46_16445 [Marinobacter salarius]